MSEESPLKKWRMAQRDEEGRPGKFTQGKAGALVDVDKATWSRWENGWPPAVSKIADLERITDISRYDLRPDIYGPAPAEAAQ